MWMVVPGCGRDKPASARRKREREREKVMYAALWKRSDSRHADLRDGAGSGTGNRKCATVDDGICRAV